MSTDQTINVTSLQIKHEERQLSLLGIHWRFTGDIEQIIPAGSCRIRISIISYSVSGTRFTKLLRTKNKVSNYKYVCLCYSKVSYILFHALIQFHELPYAVQSIFVHCINLFQSYEIAILSRKRSSVKRAPGLMSCPTWYFIFNVFIIVFDFEYLRT